MELSEKFCEKESSEVTNILRKIRSLKIKEGNLEEIMLEFFAIDQGSIALKDIVEMISYELPTHYGNRLKSHRTWKEILKEAKNLDKEYNGERKSINSFKPKNINTKERDLHGFESLKTSSEDKKKI